MYLTIKRILDIIISVVVLLCIFPMLVVIGLMIKADSEGTAFYKTTRVGKNNKMFKIIKFRTMVSDADKNGTWYTIANDERITRVGRFLRKYSIDELPQLINVLKGEMSLIGPRPNAPQQYEQYSENDFNRRHMIRPGITGLAQVMGRSNLAVDQQIYYDVYYVGNVCFTLDCKIFLKTIQIVVTNKSAF